MFFDTTVSCLNILIVRRNVEGIMRFENINIRRLLPMALAMDAIIVDVRSTNRFGSGHIPMAVNLPLERIEKGYVSLPKNRTLILYCDTGGASTKAAYKLSEMGYRVLNCVGGLKNYNGSLTK